eukprot:10715835-Alexandrium_andersonii.AAC.1
MLLRAFLDGRTFSLRLFLALHINIAGEVGCRVLFSRRSRSAAGRSVSTTLPVLAPLPPSRVGTPSVSIGAESSPLALAPSATS